MKPYTNTKMKMKIKRKELDDVNDDFSDFSLSSPARKIRRLDAELPPIIEEEEHEIPLAGYDYSMPEKHESISPIIEELPSVPVNDERAIVLFKPVNTPLISSPSNFSVSLDSGIISGFRNQILWASQSNHLKSTEEATATQGKNNGDSNGNGCLAVVPWVPSRLPPTTFSEFSQPDDDTELMEAEEMGQATMEIEENDGIIDQSTEKESNGMRGNEGFHQWQQQHCMTTQLSQNPSTPIVWYR